MPRPEKVQAVANIKERIENAQAVFLAEYAGLSVKQQQQLRRSLREEGAEFKVVKMTLARRAVAELDIDAPGRAAARSDRAHVCGRRSRHRGQGPQGLRQGP